MRIADSILAERLDHVYWVSGGPCAGKTTVIAGLAEKYGLTVYPDRHSEYQQRADFADFPALRIPWPGTDWEWFFGRSLEEYVGWLEESAAGGFEFLIADLLAEPRDKKILVDYLIDPAVLLRIGGYRRTVFMFGTAEMIRDDLLHRDDHKMILDCIKASTSDPKTMEANVVASGVEVTRRQRARSLAAGGYTMERLPQTTMEEQLTEVARHFGLS